MLVTPSTAIMAPVNPLDHISIQNVLSRYCTAIDAKDWPLLNDVFVADVDADYPFNRSLKGVDAVAKAIQGRCVMCTSSFMRGRGAITCAEVPRPRYPPDLGIHISTYVPTYLRTY